MIHWIPLERMEQLDELVANSEIRPQVIFKHSTRCSVSSMVLHRLERGNPPAGFDFYYLDLLAHRNISNAIVEKLQVHHESPQAIILRNREVIYEESHMAIQMEEIAAFS
ncbi:MAG: bacillithiol system redox-active protein YtxJ [Sediminibacterium sp.]